MAMSPAQIIQLIYILYGLIAALTLFLVFIIWKTPALSFLTASLLKRPLMYIIGKDHMGYFKTFTPKNGAASIRGAGLFHLTENSHTLEGGSKIPIYFAFRDLAATLLPEYPGIIQEIREAGFKINSLEDVSYYIQMIKRDQMDTYPIKVKPFKTYKFHDLANMFPYNLDPTFIDSTVQCEVAKFTKMMKSAPMVITTIVILLIVAAIAVLIIERAYKGQVDGKICTDMVAAAKCIVYGPGGVPSPADIAVNLTPVG